ncbi:MAG: sodium-dependent transporter [Muribaculaceae bacterium]|nr:sodium-dependent transporter [Muribaculaceae bacterium]
MAKRVGFATRLGAIAAAVGSAVGLGNIWRFPYEAGANGGGAFILVYIGCILVMGIPVILSEFIIGRSTHSNMKAALKRLSPGKKYYLFTYVCIFGSFVVIGFYSVVCGWIIEYLYQAALGRLGGHTPQEYSDMFTALVASPWRCVGWTVVFLLLNFLVMSRGIAKGIERVASVMMPLLFVILIVFCVNSLLLPGASKGLKFLFYPDFSQLTMRGVLDAFGQAFLSLSIGISCLVTYSSYFKDDTSLTKDATAVAALDTLVAILSGVMIFPAVFSFGVEPTAGPRLIFEVLPGIFQQMTGGYIWAFLFFLLVFFASLTSTISLSEIPITFMIEEHNMSRRRAIMWTALFTFVLAVLAALSFNVLDDIKLWGMNIFDIMDYAASNIFMLLGGLFTAVYVGWILDRKVVHDQLTNGGRLKPTVMEPFLIFCLRYVAPVSIFFIFLYLTGII